MAEALTYACVGGPPDDWHGLDIIDLDTGKGVFGVVEVNSAEGWLIRLKTDGAGKFFVDPEYPDEVAKERVEGRFEIRQPA